MEYEDSFRVVTADIINSYCFITSCDVVSPRTRRSLQNK